MAMNLNEAGAEINYTNEYWGQVQIDCAKMVFPGDKGSKEKPVLYEETVHKDKKPFLQLEILVDVLPECQAQFPVTLKTPTYAKDWQKIGIPSIKDLGLVTDQNGADLEKLNGMWARVAQVPGFQKNKDPEKENYKTLKFVKVFASQAECLADFEAAQGEYVHDTERDAGVATLSGNKQIALDFIESFIKAQYGIGKKADEVEKELKKFIAETPIVSSQLTFESPEVVELLNGITPF